MPYSAPEGKELIKAWVGRHPEITRIVDFGVGAGTYRDLLGEGFTWVGVEGFEPYIEQFNLREKYNEIIIKDLREIVFPGGDLAIFGDVLEHLDEGAMRQTVDYAKRVYTHLIVSIPVGHFPQGAVGGNELECHRTELTDQMFDEIFSEFAVKEKIGQIGIAILCE